MRAVGGHVTGGDRNRVGADALGDDGGPGPSTVAEPGCPCRHVTRRCGDLARGNDSGAGGRSSGARDASWTGLMPRKATPDFWLFAVALVLLSTGVVMVYSASAIVAADRFRDPYFFLKRQVFWAALGCAALWIALRT